MEITALAQLGRPPYDTLGAGKDSAHALPPRGRFLVLTSHHALAAVHGEVHDWSARRQLRITDLYRVVDQQAYDALLEQGSD